MVKHSTTITPVGPTGPGAIAGYEMRCTCSDVQCYSIATMATDAAVTHLRWHLDGRRNAR